jgi:hypothetical protein
MIKNVELNGSQFFAKDRMIRAKKLRGGPGMRGNTQPRRPANAKSNPRMTNAIVNTALRLDYLKAKNILGPQYPPQK